MGRVTVEGGTGGVFWSEPFLFPCSGYHHRQTGQGSKSTCGWTNGSALLLGEMMASQFGYSDCVERHMEGKTKWCREGWMGPSDAQMSRCQPHTCAWRGGGKNLGSRQDWWCKSRYMYPGAGSLAPGGWHVSRLTRMWEGRVGLGGGREVGGTEAPCHRS